jgi:hypothetical protein
MAKPLSEVAAKRIGVSEFAKSCIFVAVFLAFFGALCIQRSLCLAQTVANAKPSRTTARPGLGSLNPPTSTQTAERMTKPRFSRENMDGYLGEILIQCRDKLRRLLELMVPQASVA